MEKIIYLSKKLKAFTFDEIFLLAEMEKESLEKSSIMATSCNINF